MHSQIKERAGVHIQAGEERTQDAISDAAALPVHSKREREGGEREREGGRGRETPGGEQVEMTLMYVTVEREGRRGESEGARERLRGQECHGGTQFLSVSTFPSYKSDFQKQRESKNDSKIKKEVSVLLTNEKLEGEHCGV